MAIIIVIILLSVFRFTMMRKCWDMEPDKRPSFKELHTITSKYIEQIAGYLDLGFNPFTEENVIPQVNDEDEAVQSEGSPEITSLSEEDSMS